jgi:hypothetical protein
MDVEEPGLVVDQAALEGLNRDGSPGSEPASVKPGRYPLVGCTLFLGERNRSGPSPRPMGLWPLPPA